MTDRPSDRHSPQVLHPAPGRSDVRPLRIAHAVLSLDVGGLERIVLDLIREGQRLGQIACVACLEKPGVLATEAEALGAKVLSVEKSPGLRPSAIRRMASIIRKLSPDVVHTHQVGALVYAGPASRRAGRPPVLHTEHGKHYASRLRTRLLGRFAGRYVDCFACVSSDIASDVERCRIVPRSKVVVVPNGIETERFASRADREAVRTSLGIPIGAPVLGTVGRLNEVKRQDRLIRAFARLQGEPHLLIVGDGPLMDELRALAAGLGVDSRVHFAGYQSHPERFLATMDLFALTSRSEGMPLSVLEAWAVGLPVVASRVGGLPEMIDDGATGLLFDGEDEDALVGVLENLVRDSGLARRIGAAGRNRVLEKYDSRVMAATYDRYYRELLTYRGGAT